MSPAGDRFRTAARAYFAYGVVYWVGGVYLLAHGVGVSGGTEAGRGAFFLSAWTFVGLILVILIPYLLRRRRPWFERWILSRRDFARLLALFMAFRAVSVARVALRSAGGSVPAPWSGVVTFQAGAVVFFFATVAALIFVALAAWQPEPATDAA